MLLECLINLVVSGFESTFYYCGCDEVALVSDFDNICYILILAGKPSNNLIIFPSRGFPLTPVYSCSWEKKCSREMVLTLTNIDV